MALQSRAFYVAMFVLVGCPACAEGVLFGGPDVKLAQVSSAGSLTNETFEQEVELESNQTAASVFSDLKSSADELKRQIEEAEQAHIKEIQRHKENLQAILEEKRANSSMLEEENKNLRGEIASLRGKTDALFQRTKQLKLESKIWRDNWREMEQNLTLVMQVTQKTLQNTEDIFGAEDVDIISELNTQAEKEDVEAYRNDLLSKVGGKIGESLLAFTVKDPSLNDSPPTMVSVLNRELDDMAAATAAEVKKLDDDYSVIFRKEAIRMESILKDQAHLMRSKQSLLNLQDKLQIALARLEEVKQENEKKGQLIRAYAQELGLNPVPTSGTVGETWEELTNLAAVQRERLAKRVAPSVEDATQESASPEASTTELESASETKDAEAAPTAHEVSDRNATDSPDAAKPPLLNASASEVANAEVETSPGDVTASSSFDDDEEDSPLNVSVSGTANTTKAGDSSISSSSAADVVEDSSGVVTNNASPDDVASSKADDTTEDSTGAGENSLDDDEAFSSNSSPGADPVVHPVKITGQEASTDEGEDQSQPWKEWQEKLKQKQKHKQQRQQQKKNMTRGEEMEDEEKAESPEKTKRQAEQKNLTRGEETEDEETEDEEKAEITEKAGCEMSDREKAKAERQAERQRRRQERIEERKRRQQDRRGGRQDSEESVENEEHVEHSAATDAINETSYKKIGKHGVAVAVEGFSGL